MNENDATQPGSVGTEETSRETGKPRRAVLAVNRSSRLGHFGVDCAAEKLRAAGVELVEVPQDQMRDIGPFVRARRTEVDAVIVSGGDGTINSVGRALVETGLPLGVLPRGTANDFVRSVGLPFDLDAAVEVILQGFTRQIDVGEVNGHIFFNVASVGLAADLARSLTADRKRLFGRFSYALSAIRVLLRARPFHAVLLTGDDKVMVRTLQITVGNGRYYGGGNVIVHDARIDDGALDLYSLEFATVWRMALMIPSFKLGQHGAVREVRTARGGSFEILTRRPRSVNADGELVTKTPVFVTQHRLAVRVFAPPACPLDAAPAGL